MVFPIRILHVIGAMKIGGAETLIMNLYRHIDCNKIQFDFAVHGTIKGEYEEEIIKRGGIIHRFKKFNGLNSIYYIKVWDAFLNDHNEYRIVHGHIGSSASLYLWQAKKHGRFTIAHSHCAYENTIEIHDIIHRLLCYPTRFIAHCFLGCSMQAGIDRYGKKVVKSNKFDIIKNGTDTNIFTYNTFMRYSIRSELGIGENIFIVGHVGRFDYQKNHKRIINIFYQYLKENKNSKLILAGDGPEINNIKRKVCDLGLSNDVIFLGLRKNIAGLMNAMDVFIFPSIFEGLPLVLIEAQATGLRCIVSETIPDVAYITDCIKKISLKDDDKTWADEIKKIALDAKERHGNKELIQKAGFDIDEVSRSLSVFYLDIANKNNRNNPQWNAFGCL